MRNSEKGIERFIKRSSRSLRLSKTDKTDIKNHLVAFMNENPGLEVDCGYSFADFKYDLVSMRKHFMDLFQVQYVPAYFSLVILFGAGVSYASETSLPGDTLYPLKGISEKVRPLFAFADKDRAEMHLLIAERRLGEIEALYAENQLDKEKIERAKASFENHSKAFEESISAMRANGDLVAAATVSGEFKLLMNNHKIILSQLPGSVGLKNFLGKIKKEEKKWISERAAIEAELINQANPGLNEAATSESKEWIKTLDNLKIELFRSQAYLDAKSYSKVQLKIAALENLIVEVNDKINEANYEEAEELLEKVKINATEVKSILKNKKNNDEPVSVSGSAKFVSKSEVEIENEVPSELFLPSLAVETGIPETLTVNSLGYQANASVSSSISMSIEAVQPPVAIPSTPVFIMGPLVTTL